MIFTLFLEYPHQLLLPKAPGKDHESLRWGQGWGMSVPTWMKMAGWWLHCCPIQTTYLQDPLLLHHASVIIASSFRGVNHSKADGHLGHGSFQLVISASHGEQVLWGRGVERGLGQERVRHPGPPHTTAGTTSYFIFCSCHLVQTTQTSCLGMIFLGNFIVCPPSSTFMPTEIYICTQMVG